MKTKNVVVLNEYGFPSGYNPDAWRYTEWSTTFYIAIYGPKERLETLCDYVAQIVDPEGNLCPQFLWPEFVREHEAYLTIQNNPQPWQITDDLPQSGWLPQFAKDGATLYLADHNGPATYCEGWDLGGEMPHHFAKRLSGAFPDLTFVIGGVAECGYFAYAENWEIRNGKVNRMLSTVCVGDGRGLEAGSVKWEIADGTLVTRPEYSLSGRPDWEYYVDAGVEHVCPTCGKTVEKELHVHVGAETGTRYVDECRECDLLRRLRPDPGVERLLKNMEQSDLTEAKEVIQIESDESDDDPFLRELRNM